MLFHPKQTYQEVTTGVVKMVENQKESVGNSMVGKELTDTKKKIEKKTNSKSDCTPIYTPIVKCISKSNKTPMCTPITTIFSSPRTHW